MTILLDHPLYRMLPQNYSLVEGAAVAASAIVAGRAVLAVAAEAWAVGVAVVSAIVADRAVLAVADRVFAIVVHP